MRTGSGPGVFQSQVLHDRADRLLVADSGGELPTRGLHRVDDLLSEGAEQPAPLRARADDRVQRERRRYRGRRSPVALRDHRVVRDADAVLVVGLTPDGVAERVLVVEPPQVGTVRESVVRQLRAEQLGVAFVLVVERRVTVHRIVCGHGLARVAGDCPVSGLPAGGRRPPSHCAAVSTPTAAATTIDTSAGAR